MRVEPCPPSQVTKNEVTSLPLRYGLTGEFFMYIDPTTGSLVLQFLAAGVLSVLAMASRVREAVKSFFKSLVPRRGRWAGKP